MSAERLRHIADQVRDRLIDEYRNDAVSGALNEEGDAVRRLAATKLSVLSDVMIRLKTLIKEEA